MIFLTILNTIAIIIIFGKQTKYYINIRKDQTFINNTLLGYHVTLWKKTSKYSASGIYTLVIPIRNARKQILKEEIERLIGGSSQNRLQTLTAKFSWLKTWKEAKKFEKDYSIVDKDIVKKLVNNFVPKVV